MFDPPRPMIIPQQVVGSSILTMNDGAVDDNGVSSSSGEVFSIGFVVDGLDGICCCDDWSSYNLARSISTATDTFGNNPWIKQVRSLVPG